MAKPRKTNKETTTVREHPLRVPVSVKNPTGVTVRHRHVRKLKGSYLSRDEVLNAFVVRTQKSIAYPAKGKLQYPNADDYDDLIAFWTDYFNRKFPGSSEVNPDVVKALLGSESSFKADPKTNRKIALGIAQITKRTLQILQDDEGEASDFIFSDIRQKDLSEPAIAIPLAVRWLHKKRETARKKLGREPTHEEIILEYKGLTKSTSNYKNSALRKYRLDYEKLTK